MSNTSVPDTVEAQLLQHKRIALAKLGIPLFSARDGHLASTLAHQQEALLVSEPEKIANLLEDGSANPESADAADSVASKVQSTTEFSIPNQADAGSIPAVSPDWGRLSNSIQKCTLCPLHQNRLNAVIGDGVNQADWMVVGDAPGAEEDASGKPYVGDNGSLLDAMFAALGLTREHNLYITNIIKSRPPNNRDPLPDELEACWPYLVQQFSLVKPKVVIAVGRVAAHRLLGEELPMSELRGKVHQIIIGQVTLPLIVTYHPAYLMRSPSQKAKAWEDMCLAWHCYQKIIRNN